jgi:SNF2 family DNA or RNA helicase
VRVKKTQIGALEPLWKYATSSESLCDLKNKLQSFSGIQEALPSNAFQGKLRPYQQQGVNWLAFLYEYGFHGILADEMGLGKTIQILAFLSQLPVKGPHLIILPTSLLFNWRNEIRNFLPLTKCTIHQGGERAKTREDLQNADIILTSYTTLRLDLPLLLTLSYSCVILDEAQMIKNAHTQTAQAVCQLTAQLRLCLTGTPVENHLQELWSHFHFLMPDLFGSQERFEADIQAAQADRRYLERIKRKVAPFLLRRRKQDVATDLPPRIDQVVWIEMPEEQRVLYDQLLAGFKSGLLKKVEAEGIGKHRLEVLEALLRLRQVCCHPLLVSSLFEQPVLASAKFDALLHDLETIVEEGRKVLVYSQFTSMLKLMTQAARERQWTYSYLDGSTQNREEVVTRFQDDPSQLLFFISLKAGGVGLNLTAADYVYIYDPWWNEAVEEQAINRAHRIGRESVVIAKRFVLAESVEEKMMRLKAAKRLMIEDLLEGEALSSNLTLDDLQILLS